MFYAGFYLIGFNKNGDLVARDGHHSEASGVAEALYLHKALGLVKPGEMYFQFHLKEDLPDLVTFEARIRGERGQWTPVKASAGKVNKGALQTMKKIMKQESLRSAGLQGLQKQKKEPLKDYSIVYRGQKIAALNENMVERQKLDATAINKIKRLHIAFHELKLEMEKVSSEDRETLKDYVGQVEALEFEMQQAWGFKKDARMHTYWHCVPHCTCPFHDNRELYGTGQRSIDSKCPLHSS